MTRVAVLDDYQHRAHELADWSSLGGEVAVSFFHDPMDEETLVENLVGFEIIALMRERTPFPRRVLERLPALQLLLTTGMENASVDSAFLRERGVTFSGTTSGSAPGPVEIAWALIFATNKRLVIEDRLMRAGGWQSGLPRNLAGLTLGIAGLGRLGGGMVAPARVFGMEIVAWSENLTEERALELEVEKVTKEELLSRADVLSIHLRLSDRTRGTFGAKELALMKHDAVLINTARGPIVDEDALLEVLRSGRIAAAGLDVYDKEPLPPGHPLTELDNTVLAPHLGYVSEKGFRGMYGNIVEDIAAFLKGAPIRVIA
jgi:phosphoglycerate dehydrogenase-like enzyme